MSTPDRDVDEVGYVTVVEAPGCHFCAEAQAALAELAKDYPLVVGTVDVRSEMGQYLVQKYRAALNPLVLLDGEFFSHGRLPKRKLARQLSQRFGRSASTDRSGRG